MRTYEAKMDKERLAEMPVCSIKGKIFVVDEADKVEFAVGELRKAGMIGFDTETRPSFVKGFRYRIALLQLSTKDVCFLFRLQLIGPNEMLKELLEDRSVVKIGLSTRDDARSLQTWMACRPAGFIEIQQLVRHFGIEELSLQKIYALVFGERISKTQQLSNWEAQPLTQAQQVYAATDAWTCMRLYERFMEDDGEYMKEMCREMVEGGVRKKVEVVQVEEKPKEVKKKPKRRWYVKRKKRASGGSQRETEHAPSVPGKVSGDTH